jgi:SAM-dependent methyltransferase
VKPAAWLVENLDVIPRGGMVLDVACGGGRHALFLAERGWRVHAVDRDVTALAELGQVGQVGQVGRVGQVGEITTEHIDLESGNPTLGDGLYDAVIVFNYLHRPLMPAIVSAVRPGGGVLIYETFTVGQAQRGRPRSPDFLLRDGELPALVAPLRVLRVREGDYEGALVASVVAIRD